MNKTIYIYIYITVWLNETVTDAFTQTCGNKNTIKLSREVKLLTPKMSATIQLLVNIMIKMEISVLIIYIYIYIYIYTYINIYTYIYAHIN